MVSLFYEMPFEIFHNWNFYCFIIQSLLGKLFLNKFKLVYITTWRFQNDFCCRRIDVCVETENEVQVTLTHSLLSKMCYNLLVLNEILEISRLMNYSYRPKNLFLVILLLIKLFWLSILDCGEPWRKNSNHRNMPFIKKTSLNISNMSMQLKLKGIKKQCESSFLSFKSNKNRMYQFYT